MEDGVANRQHEIFTAGELPRMTSDVDRDLAARMLEGLPADATLVEVGPWLGGMSEVLGGHGHLHVIDSFIWTKEHDKRVPGLVAPGESFRPIFDALMQSRGLSVDSLEAEIETFRWGGGPIDYCLIDAPKKPALLRDTLVALAPGLDHGARLLIKNANHASYFAMTAYLQELVEAGLLTILEADAEGRCNTVAFEVSVPAEDIVAIVEQADVDPLPRWHLVEGPMGGLGPFQLSLICELIQSGAWSAAYEVAGRMAPSRRILREWDKRELKLANAKADPEQLGWFAEVMSLQHAKGGLAAPPKSMRTSPAMVRRAYWTNNANKPWRARAFHPPVFERAFDYGYLVWSDKIKEHLSDMAVLDVGCGPGLHGLGYIAAGAKSYLGLDPIIKLDKDRVKNLQAGSEKMAFGWTPTQLSDMIEPWDVQPTAIEDLPEDRVFDLAIMHNVTEHLHQIESVFDAIAKRLKPGGRLLYNHHNYYSWNGHHVMPKIVEQIDLSDPAQQEMIDWGHVEFEPDPTHYIARGLNRIRLDDLIALTERHFEIDVHDERFSGPKTGFGRLTDEIRQRYPYLDDRDFETQNLFCIATVKA